MILTNRLSASASEIFAAALQDYGRAVIVGDQNTFGKGTVQTMIEIGRYIPMFGSATKDAGALKLTIQKFYRISGGSTQLRGVTSDIRIPSLYDRSDLAESALKNPMPYDEVAPVRFDKITDHPLYIQKLKERSATRVASDPEFRYVIDDLDRLKSKIAANKISLKEKARRTEIADEKTRKERELATFEKVKLPEQKIYQVTLDNVDKPTLELATHDKKNADNAAAAAVDDLSQDFVEKSNSKAFDPVRIETLHILSDLADLSRSQKNGKFYQP